MKSKYTLDELCYKITDGSHSSPKAKQDGKYMFSVKDMNDFGFNYENAKIISINDFEKLVKQGCKPEINDVLIAKDGSVMKHIFAVKEDIDAVLLSSIAILKPKIDIIDPQYFVYELLNPSMYNYILNNFKSGTGVPRIVLKDFKKIEITIPPLSIQKKIAHILSTLDDKIELNRKMNQTLEDMAQTIFKSWFVDFDPVHAKANCTDEAEFENIAKELGISKEILDLFPSEFIESELGMIPKGWKIINFKDLVEKYIDNRGKTPPLVENGIPLLEVRTLPNEMLSSEYLTDKCVSDEIYNTWFRTHLETDDILISTVGTIGLTSIVPPNSKFVIAQNVLGIRANEEFILKKFMFYLMKSKFFIDAINARLVTTVQSSIKRKDMETINIIIPDFSTQKEFVKIVTPIMEKMQSNEILNLEKTRDTLLPKLLSGEIDVSELKII